MLADLTKVFGRRLSGMNRGNNRNTKYIDVDFYDYKEKNNQKQL